jgi:hypothetical protein
MTDRLSEKSLEQDNNPSERRLSSQTARAEDENDEKEKITSTDHLMLE